MRRSACTAATFLLAVLVLAAPAAARPGGVAGAGPIEGRLRTGNGTVESTNWSGYAAHGATFTEAKGRWTQPRVDCSSVRRRQIALAAFWVGLDGYESNTVEQTGTEADCEGSTEVRYAWYELYPQRLFVVSSTEHPVEPGDEFSAQVTQSSLTLEDRTRGWKATEEYAPSGLRFNSAEWIAEGPSKSLSDFEAVDFSSASASTATVTGGGPIENGENWKADKILMVNHPGRRSIVRAEPGKLIEEGSAFSIAWLHS